MELRSHFNLGDKAWHLYSDRVEAFDPCPCCKEGKVPLANGSSLQCPRCAGKGAIALRGVLRWNVERNPLTIGQIRFEVESEESKEEYMCRETGVGSGSIHRVSDLYQTRELAQAEADRRNNIPGMDWACSRCNVEFEPILYSLGFEHRDWRHCSIHGSTQHVNVAKATADVEARNKRLAALDEKTG